MEATYYFSGPIAQRFTWTLLHFLWQGAVLAGLLEIATYLLGGRSIAVRYRLALGTLILIAVCPAVTFWYVRSEPRAAETRQRSPVELTTRRDTRAITLPISVDPHESADTILPSSSQDAPAVEHGAPPPPPQVSTLARWQPWLLAGWAIGAALFGLRLLIGGRLAWQMRRGRLPLDAAWADRAQRLAARMGLDQVRVFVSTRVRQALVTGVWRPMVLLPAAWLAEMPPEMLEGVLAHELAHLRRLDLWAILLQRLVETFLFYHPAVWWLSRRLSREREMCCDEMAVAAIGDRLAFTKALQWAVQGPAAGHPLAGHGPVLGAAWKGSRKMVLERIRRLLGADVPRERFFWWPLGLAALVVPALLMFSALSAKEVPPAEKPGDGTPTLAAIAKANEAAWAAIRSVDMEFETTDAIVVDGKKVREVRSPGLRWSMEGGRERFRGRFTKFQFANLIKFLTNDFDGSFGESARSKDYYLDGPNKLQYNVDQYNGGIAICSISPPTPKTHFLDPRPRYVEFTNGERMTLAELIACRRVTIKGKQISKDGDTLWLLEAENPPLRDFFGGARPPTYTRICVNADKGFLISSVEYTEFYLDPGQTIAQATEERRLDEVTKFQDCGHGVYLPAEMVSDARYFTGDAKNADKRRRVRTSCATRLLINMPLPGDALAFRFPDRAVVYEYDANGNPGKVSIWGPDNRPVREFDTQKDYLDFADRGRLEQTRKEIEKKNASKEPADLKQRAEYYFGTKEYDKALPAFEALIAADSKSQTAAEAHYGCGLICLLRDREFDRAAADFSECLRWYEGKSAAEKSKDVGMDLRPFYFLRGMAYANQADGLDRALADMTTVIECKMPPDPFACYARLIRSAIYLRRNELYKAGLDVAAVLRGDIHLPGDSGLSSLMVAKDAYGLLSLILAKQGGDDHSKAMVNQQLATLSAVTQRPSTAPEDPFNDVFGGILHRTLRRLVPALNDLAPVGIPSDSKIPAEQQHSKVSKSGQTALTAPVLAGAKPPVSAPHKGSDYGNSLMEIVDPRIVIGGEEEEKMPVRPVPSSMPSSAVTPASLPAPAAAATQVEVKVAVLEIDRAKSRNLGFDLDKLPACLDGDKQEGIVAALRHDGLVRILSEPQIATESGRPATVNVATVVDKDRVRVECHLRFSRKEGTNVAAASGETRPVTGTFSFDSSLELRPGRTMVLSGGRLKSASGERQILVLLTAILHAGKDTQPSSSNDDGDRWRAALRQQAAARTITEWGGSVWFSDKSNCRPKTGLDEFLAKSVMGVAIGEEEEAIGASGAPSVKDWVEQLKEFPGLQVLTLTNDEIDDTMLANIERLSELEELNLAYCKITDKGLEHLKPLTRLRTLTIRETQVTATGVEAVGRALPHCKITFEPAVPTAARRTSKQQSAAKSTSISTSARGSGRFASSGFRTTPPARSFSSVSRRADTA